MDKAVSSSTNRSSINICELIMREAAACLSGNLDRIAIINQRTGRDISYTRLFEWTNELAHELATHGVKPLGRVGLVMDNSPEYVALSLAVLKLNAAIVPVSPEHTGMEINKAMQQIGVSHVIYTEGGPYKDGSEDDPLISDMEKKVRLMSMDGDTGDDADSVTGYADIRPAFIRFSSGTTGDSKGVVLSHQDIEARTTAADAGLNVTHEDNVVWLLSMSFHFVVTILLFLRRGAGIIICHDPLAEGVVRAANEQGGTLIYAAPYHYDMLASDDDVSADALSLVRLAISTTVRLPVSIADRFNEKFGLPLTEAYGIIEVGLPFVGIFTSSIEGSSLGRVLPAYEIRIDSPDDSGVGEILLKGPGMFSAYFSPWQTRAEALDGGEWFRTGDMGRLGHEGELYIVGRRKNMINFSGMKIFPYEVEEVINSFPGVRESLVYPEAHERYGQLPMAKIVPDDIGSPPDMRGLRRYCYERMAQYKVPKGFEILEQPLPRTKSGKIIRH